MSIEFTMVQDFNRLVLGIEPREKGLQSEDEVNLTIKQLNEEVKEFAQSWDDQDYIQSIDSIMDLMYFSYGVLYKMGLNSVECSEIFDVIHTANMSKKIGVKKGREGHEAADAIKPEGWKSPEERIMEILK